MSVATIVLAAGGSTRMGRSKQLLEHRGEAMVRRAVRAAIEAQLGPVFVVVGAQSQEVSAVLADLGVSVVGNLHWEEGMGTSIALGVEHAERDPAIEAALVMLSDQPMVDAHVLRRLADAWRGTRADAVACLYGSSRGVPAIYARGLFQRLRGLPPTGGAKRLLADEALRVVTIDFPDGAIDIDTPQDYELLGKKP